ncbi:MAG: class I SAM-dependent methyltransferase [Actinobacteria bacterium]|nr:class I SAM-dependent methyltransferase [Actinomycetota bacterium]
MTNPQQTAQETQYAFPYHWLPVDAGAYWVPGRDLGWVFEYANLLTSVADEVAASGARRVLDFGCGDGRLVGHLTSQGIDKVDGVDMSERAVAFARAFATARGPGMSVFGSSLGEVDGPYDVVTAMEVIEHVPDGDLPAVVDGLAGCLAPNGRLIVTVPTTVIPLSDKHERHYDVGLLKAHLSPQFEIEKVRYLHRDNRWRLVLRRVISNRWFSVRDERCLRIAWKAYERYCRHAAPEDGIHILAVAELAP